MKKISFKKVFSRAFVISLAALAVTNVDALTINETAGKEIEEGSYVLGISRFTPGTVLTAVRVSKATTNDNNFNKDVVGYEGANIYYYDLGEWYVLNDDNKAVPVTDAKVIKSLTARDIYYVDNVEKTYDIKYQRDIPEGKALFFATDKANKKPVYDASKGILSIPVTAKSVTVKLVNEKDVDKENPSGTLLDTYMRTYTDDDKLNFEYESSKASVGTIAADDKVTMSKDVTISGNTINIGGTVKWDSVDPAGHKVGVLLTLPNGTNPASLANVKVEVTRGNGKVENLTWANNSTTLRYTPIVKDNETMTIKVTWLDKTTQTFTVRVTGQLEEMPAGKLSGKTEYVYDTEKNDYTDEVRLSAKVASDGSNITFSGKDFDWDGIATVYVEPNEYFTSQDDFKYSAITASYTNITKNPNYDPEDKLSTEQEFINTDPATPITPGIEEIDGKKVFVLEVPLKENNDTTGRTATVTIDWKNGYKQTFDVVLADNTPFVYPTVKLDATDTSDITFKVDADDKTNIDVKGYVKWNIGKGGNVVTTTLDASSFVTADQKYLSVKVDGKTVTHTVKKTVDGKTVDVEEVLTFDKTVAGVMSGAKYTWDLVVKQGEDHTITLMYGEAEVKTYKLHISADTEDNKQGTVALTSADDANFDLNRLDATSYEVVGDYDGTTKKYKELDYDYNLGKNAVDVEITNATYQNVTGIKVTTKVGAEEAVETTFDAAATTGKGTFAIPLVSGKTTTVTVEWDSLNKQTFTVSPKAGKVEFKKPETGEISHTAGTQSEDKKTVSYKDEDISWSTDGYKLTGLTIKAPTGVTPDEDVATISISGGDYQNVDEDEPGYFKYTLTDAKTANKLTHASGTITLTDFNVTATNQTFKITVAWTKNYSVTYTLDIVDATLVNDYKDATLTVNNITNNNNKEVVYNGNIDYDSTNNNVDMYSVDAHLQKITIAAVPADPDNGTPATPAVYGDVETADITGGKIEIIDAKSTKSYTQKNGVVSSTDVAREVTTLTAGKTKVYFSDEVKTATIKVTYKTGYVDTFTIDANTATLAKINLTNKVVEDASHNYSTTVHVGDEINLVSVTSTVTGITATPADAGTKAYASDTNGVYRQNADGTYTATAAGKVVFNIADADASSNSHAKGKSVTVYVLGENDGKINITNPSVTFIEGEGTKISVVPVGGRDSYSVTVDIEEFNEGTGNYDSVSTGTTLAKEFNSDVYSVKINSLDSAKHYKYTIKATAGTAGTLVGEYGNAEVEVDDNVITYKVTFDTGKGSTVANQTVKAGKKAEMPKITRESADGYYYILKGWYEVNATNFDEDGNYKNLGGKKLDINGDIILDPTVSADATLIGTLFDTIDGEFNLAADSYNFNNQILKDVTLKAVWYRIPLEK